MVSQPTLDPQRVLDYLAKHGPSTLARMTKDLRVLKLDLVQATNSLQSRALIVRVLKPSGSPSDSYRLAPKPQPRTDGKLVPSGTYTGVDWSTATSRPGCLDHLAHPSRRGDLLVPHMPAQGIES